MYPPGHFRNPKALVLHLALVVGICERGATTLSTSRSQIGEGLGDCAASIVQWIVLLTCTIVGDSADDFRRIVAAGEGPFRVRPVMFGLG
jgi:hypothetical protein